MARGKATTSKPTMKVEEFVVLWQSADTVTEVARACGRSATTVRTRATYLRQRGVPMKRMPMGRQQVKDDATADIEHLRKVAADALAAWQCRKTPGKCTCGHHQPAELMASEPVRPDVQKASTTTGLVKGHRAELAKCIDCGKQLHEYAMYPLAFDRWICETCVTAREKCITCFYKPDINECPAAPLASGGRGCERYVVSSRLKTEEPK